MLGPFSGRVVDGDSNKPIADAIVWCSWAFNRGVGHSAPLSAKTASTRTDADGRYRIEELRDLPSGASVRLARLSFVVYKRGYTAFRHNRGFGGGFRARPFAQLNNVVTMTRFSPEQSRARHLLFIGGDEELQRATQWERRLASDQLTQQAKQSHTRRSVSDLPDSPPIAAIGAAEHLLTSDEIRRITGFDGALRRAKLAEPRDTTDTIHFRAENRGERYDVAVRYWKLSGDALGAKFEELFKALPEARRENKIGDRSFFVVQGEIAAVGFADDRHDAVVIVTCGRGQCVEDEQVRQLARQVHQRLSQRPAGTR